MNLDLEERLGKHLTRQSLIEHDPEQLAAVHKRARRRSMRNRVAAGVVGLAALAGLGSLVPTNDKSNALITATEPTPSTTVQEQVTPAPAAPVPDGEVDGLTIPPAGYEIVSDGQGGFVAIELRTSTGLVKFARSVDGENWFRVDGTEFGAGLRINRLRRVDDHFVLELDTDTRDIASDASPRLALSTDLINWQIVDLGVGPDDPSDGQLVRYSVGDIAINGNDIAVVILEYGDIDLQHYDLTEREVCGFVKEQDVATLSLCDGTLLSLDDSGGTQTAVQRVLISRNGERAVELEGFVPRAFDVRAWPLFSTTVLPQDETFAILGADTDVESLLAPRTLAQLGELNDWQALGVAASAGQQLTILRNDDRLVPVLTSASGEAVGTFPADLLPRMGLDIPRVLIEHGPAGWVVSITDDRWSPTRIQHNGWEFFGFQGSPSGEIRSLDGDARLWISSSTAQLPPGVQMSIFGGVRYFHPVTGGLLVELTADEAPINTGSTEQLGTAQFDRTVEVDGWTIGGHPLLGPLTLTSPTGITTEYSDGFAFDNDDITDGVEADIGSAAFGDFALRRTGLIRFYDDAGNELIEVRGRELFDEMVVPILGTPNEQGRYVLERTPNYPERPTAVLHSENGLDWNVVWSYVPGDDGEEIFITNIAVGDDELLIGTPMDIVRIPLDE